MNLIKNRTIRLLLAFSLVLLSVTILWPQTDIPIGTWRNHLAYNRTYIVQEVGDEIFCVSEHGMFIYRPEDNGIQLLSKINGLSDVTLSAISYNMGTGIIILGYDNGNIDLVEEQGIYSLTDIKKAGITYDKGILDIEYDDQFIYFITEFGVVVYDQAQNAFKETWQNLGETGDFLAIRKGAILRDTLFLATERGVIAGNLGPGNNLLDFRNWKRYQADQGLPREYTREIETYDQDLYVVQDEKLVYRYNRGSWEQVFGEIAGPVISTASNSGALTFTSYDRVYYLTGVGALHEVTDDHFLSLQNAILVDEDLYAADLINGLIHVRSGSSEVIRPSGPFSNDVFKILDVGESMIAVPKGFDEQYQPLRNSEGFYFFNNGSWTNYNNSGGFGYNSLPDISDLVDITCNDIGDKIYFASFGYGMLEWDLADQFKVYNEHTPGVTLINSNPPEPFTLVPAMDLDHGGKVWMANYNTSVPLHEYEDPETWKGHGIAMIGSSYITDLIVTADNNKWMTVHPGSGGGIIVYNEGLGKVRWLTSQPGNGGLPDNNVNAIIEDREGQIWLGTTDGIAYYPFPFLVFDEPDFEAVRPIYENNVLFKNETITCLDVDGGNRKWVGTYKGAWLFGPDGTELVAHYDLQNSPVLSDKIIDIEVNQVTGEVFFGTDKGMVSFRGDAVESDDRHSSVKIFPNPVTPNFNGIVGIEGLPQHSIVKITDISGNLVFQTRSEGGMATWNVLDYNGIRPDTGVYLVFSSTEDGSDTFVGKIAIVK